MPRNAQCTDCKLGANTGMRCVWGQGPGRAKIFLVGEAPGGAEERIGRPFQGPAGKTLNAALSEAGLRREEVYVSNVVKCRPPGNRDPLQVEMDTCIHYLLDEIDLIQPEVIVCLGATALKALTGKSTIAQVRGKEIEPKRWLHTAATVMASYHPAASFSEPSAYPKLVADFRIIRRMVYGQGAEEAAPHSVTVVPPGTPDATALAALSALDECQALYVDLEWTAGKPEKGKGIIWPWSRLGEAYSIALTGRSASRQAVSVSLSFPLPEPVRAKLYELLKKFLVFHNAMADGLWLDHLGLGHYNLRYDTMLLAYLADETQALNLEAVAAKYADNLEGGWKGHLFKQRPSSSGEWEEILTYGANDTYATMLSFEGLWRAIKRMSPERQQQIRRVNDLILIPITKILERASLVGLPMNEEKLNRELEATRARRDASAERLAKMIGVTPTQARKLCSSPQKVVDFVSNSLYLPIADAQKSTLSELSEEFPPIKAMQEVKTEDKLESTYLDPWSWLLARQGDSALHSIFKVYGTGTGRLSMDGEGRGGTMHTAPRQSWLRNIVEAPDGYVIVAGDFSMVELRVLAWIAEEQTMLRLFREGQDLHKATAAYLIACKALGRIPTIGEWWPERNEWIGRVTKVDRDNAKPVNFGLCYSMAAEGLQSYSREAYGMKMTLDEAQQMHAGYFSLYSDLPRWHEMKRATVGKAGEDTTVFGRRRQYDATNLNACINTPIQSAASDFTLLALTQIDRAYRQEGLDALIVGTVHDSILVKAHEQHAERAKVVMKYEMEHVDTSAFGFTIPIPLPADVTYAKAWGG